MLTLAPEAAGYAVSSATCAVEALRALDEEPPALAICDLLLPDSDGFGVLAAERVHRHVCDIHAIAPAGPTTTACASNAGALPNGEP